MFRSSFVSSTFIIAIITIKSVALHMCTLTVNAVKFILLFLAPPNKCFLLRNEIFDAWRNVASASFYVQ